MDFRILGPLEAVADGRVVALDAAKPRALLAILLLHAGEPVSRDRLIEDLWDGRPPATAAKVLQTYVSQLRKALGSDVIVTAARGLRARRRAGRLRPAPLRAPRGRSTGERADGRGASVCARRSRCGAGRRSSSSPTSGGRRPRSAGSRSFASPRCRIASTRISLSAATATSSASSSSLVSEHPLSERLRGQLMLALYRCRQAGRGARGLPGGAGDAGRDARDRAGRRAAAARAPDPRPGPGPRRHMPAPAGCRAAYGRRRARRRDRPRSSAARRSCGRSRALLHEATMCASLTLTGAGWVGEDASRRRGHGRPRRRVPGRRRAGRPRSDQRP